MKKLLLTLFVAFSLTALVGCGKKEKAQEYKLGMGVVVTDSESKDTTAQIDATVATVVLDSNNKIVACRLDVAQNKITVSAQGEVTVPTTFKSKVELGDDYGMSNAVNYGMDWNGDGVTKEWYQQAEAFENYVVGKTAEEVKNMPTQVVPTYGYVISSEADLLAAGCTIQITDFKEAVYKACTDEQGVSFKTSKKFTLGVAVTSFDDGSTSATADANGQVKVYSDFAATVLVEGKIQAALNDAIQPKFTVTTEGAYTFAFTATKRELKENYNMAAYGTDGNGDGIVKEWYEQSLAFSKHVVGMTGEEVKNMETKANLINYQMSTDEALLAAGCTIQITDIKAVVAKACTNAR